MRNLNKAVFIQNLGSFGSLRFQKPVCKAALSEFRQNIKGSFAPIAAIGLTAIMAVIGVSVQYSSLSRDKSDIRDALDAAVLVGALTPGSEAEKKKAARRHFLANTRGRKEYDGLRMRFDLDGDKFTGRIKINPAQYFVPFVEKIDRLVVESAAAIGTSQNVEVSLVLDFSDSMGVNGKLAEMKAAATSFISNMEDLQDLTEVKMALTPFAALTAIDVPEEYIVDTPIYADYDGSSTNKRVLTCTGDRRYPYNANGKAPNTTVSESKFGDNAGGYYRDDPDSCKTLFIDTNLIAQPLNNDLEDIQTALDKMQVSALTHLALGMDIGWQMLNPDKPFSGGASFSSKKTKKFLIFLTDGAQSAPAYGPGDAAGAGEVAQGWANLSAICAGAKNDGVTVMTIAYDINAGNASQWVTGTEEADLKACASDPSLAFAPGASNGQLQTAFDNISQNIKDSVLRLVY